MEMPPLVRRALAQASGFESSCEPEEGALLHVLASRRGTMRAAEIGTGVCVSAAWIVSGLPPQTPFFSAEIDPELAGRAAEFFAADPNVTVLAGSWRASLPTEAPFDFLFVDTADAKDDPDAVAGLVAPGGTVVLDDFRLDPSADDPRRDVWLQHPHFAGIELYVTPSRRAIVAVRT